MTLCERGHNGVGYAENGRCAECERQRQAPRVPLPFTDLATLEREHKRLKELRDAGVPDRIMPEAWAKHLAKVLKPHDVS